jgi:hypothetical protein
MPDSLIGRPTSPFGESANRSSWDDLDDDEPDDDDEIIPE